MSNKRNDLHTKEYYEIEKLKTEIAEIRRPYYKKLPFWHFISTTLIAIGTITLLYFNGAFDFKTKALELKRENLEYDIRQFTSEKTNLKNQIELNKIDLVNLVNIKNELQKQNAKLEYAYKMSNGSLSEKNKYVASLLATNKLLNEEYNELKSKSTLNNNIAWLKPVQSSSLSDLINNSENNNSTSFPFGTSTALGSNSLSSNSNIFTNTVDYSKLGLNIRSPEENSSSLAKYIFDLQKDSSSILRITNKN